MTIERQKVGDKWVETTSRRFDPDVPSDVFEEVQRNMERDGWTYVRTTGVEIKGQLVMVQHYQRPATEAAGEEASQ